MDFDAHLKELKQTDPTTYELIQEETERQRTMLELIPSESLPHPAVMEASGSFLMNKYSEGMPGARYYGGNDVIDKVENLARDRAKELFGVPYANVQPYSGSPANFAVYFAVCEKGDTVMGLDLPDGGHLTHGWKHSATSYFYESHPYHVKEDGYIDIEEVERLAKEHKPKLMWVGATAYSREFPFEKFAEIADSVGAYLAADTSHISGLIVSGAHKSPVEYVHIVTTTTHKTLRGPRGGIIMVTEKGLKKDPDLPTKIDKAIIPGLQGGPHNHQTAAIAVALSEAMKPEFKELNKKIVHNAKALGEALKEEGFELASDGTDNHLLIVKLGKARGPLFEVALDAAGITVNKNTIPKDPSNPLYPSGIRIGTPIITTRGMGDAEMKKIAAWMSRVREIIASFELPEGKGKKEYVKDFEEKMSKDTELEKIKKEVEELCLQFQFYS